MPDPSDLLQKAIGRLTTPLVMTLATVASDRSPRARSVICRRIDDQYSLWFTSDARSQKNEQLRAAPAAEAVWWIPDARWQFRFRGVVEIFGETHSIGEPKALWNQLSDDSRAMFFWPAPGLPRIADENAFRRRVPPEESPPITFEVLVLRAGEIEHLDLSHAPHDRRLWRSKNQWRCEELNP